MTVKHMALGSFVLAGLLTILVLKISPQQRNDEEPAMEVMSWAPTTFITEATMDAATAFNAAGFTIHHPIRLMEVRPASADEALELVDARVLFLTSQRRAVPSGMGGDFCPRWPLEEPYRLPSYPVQGLELVPGEAIYVALILLAKEPGDWISRGVTVVYEHDGKRKEISADMTTTEIIRRRTVDELPQGRMNCNPDVSYL